MKIYTKTGDSGHTGLYGGQRVPKSDPRIMAYGTLDEASAMLGLAACNSTKTVRDIIHSIQKDIFILGADLSNPDNVGMQVTASMTDSLERMIDKMDATLPALTNFILPGGGHTGSALHLARAIVRRAETHITSIPESEHINPECIRYTNRLSDFLFVLARKVNHDDNIPEHLWNPAS